MGTQSSDILEINTATSESKVRGREEGGKERERDVGRGREGGRERERGREKEGGRERERDKREGRERS